MTPDATDVTPGTPRYVVTGGGSPTAEQLAALAVAMTPVVVVPDRDPASIAAPEGIAPWARAAILEAIGHRTFVAMPDLVAGRFPLR